MTRGGGAAAASFVLCVAACGLSKLGTGENGDPQDGGAEGSVIGGEGGTVDAGVAIDGALDAAVVGQPIFGITATDLYRFQPETATLTKVGGMTGCKDITDIALDANGIMYAAGNGLFTVNTSTGACAPLSAVTQPFTLSVVPVGALHPSNEALVAYLGSDYVEIDSGSGTRSDVKQQAINPYQPSGDVVAEIGAGMYVSVTDSTCATDCILQVKPSDGSIVKNWGASGSTGVVGLAMSQGILYGFLGNGTIVRFAFSGSSVTSNVIATAEKPVWIGAGSRTNQ